MIENLKILSRDIKDAKPLGSNTLKTKDCDPTGDCATSCSDCESSSAASCGTCEGGRMKKSR